MRAIVVDKFGVPDVLELKDVPGENGHKKAGAGSPEGGRNFDSHESQLEELIDDSRVEYALFIHFPYMRANRFISETRYRLLEQAFFFGEF